ncbi:MAG: DUF6263 family protein, partial [Ferruginibacter sp.]
MKKITFFIAGMLTVPAMIFAQNGGTVKLSNGQKYSVENKITTASTSEMQGQSMETTADVTTVYNIEVNDTKDDNYNMTNKIATVKFNMNTMGQNISFDSEKKEDMDGQMGSSFKEIVNQPKAVTMDKNGNIVLSKVVDTATKESTSPTDMMLKQLGDPQAIGYGAKIAFLSIPADAKVGTAWTDSTSSEGVTRVTNYVVKSIDNGIATITLSGTETRDTKMEMQGVEIGTKTTGTFNGQQTADIKTGIINQNNFTADAKGTISVMGQEIPTTIKATS